MQHDTVIDVGQAFGWLAPYINSLIGVGITAGLTWLGTLTHKWFNVQLDDGARKALTAFLQRQAASLVADGWVKLDGLRVNVHSPALALAAQNAEKAVPDALKRFGLTPNKVADMIVDYIHSVPAIATAAADPHKPLETKPAA